jgi:hypothetical protein
MRTSIRPVVDRSTTGTVAGALATMGVAAAAGLGIYGYFTGSTTPTDTAPNPGTPSINLAQPGAAVPISVAITDLIPGASTSRAVNLINDGPAPMSEVSVTSAATTAPNVLTTDPVNGLQLAVKSCSVAWTQGGTASAPSYSCSGTERTMLSGAVLASEVPLDTPASLAAGGADNLVFSISLPMTADNTFQGKSASLSLTFTAVQRAGTVR